jgi:co-chaperonin GroES (HSP10)
VSAEIEVSPGIFVTVTRVLGDRVLLRELPDDMLGDTTEGGIVIPEQSADHQRLMQGEILAVGDAVEDATLLPGLRVICGRWRRVPLAPDGTTWVCSEDEIEALLTITTKETA